MARVLLTPDGFLNRIVEYKDATPSERAVTLCNAGVYAADAEGFFRWAGALKNDNAQSEYYLTDVPGLARKDGVKCAVAVVDEVSVTGVNSRAELAGAEDMFQQRRRSQLLTDGVTMTAPHTVFFSHDTAIENDVTIEPFVIFGPGVTVKTGATHPQPFAPGGCGGGDRRDHRSFCSFKARCGDRRRRACRQFRRDQEYAA